MFGTEVNFNDSNRFVLLVTDNFWLYLTVISLLSLFRIGNPEFISEKEPVQIVMQAMTTMKDRDTRIHF